MIFFSAGNELNITLIFFKFIFTPMLMLHSANLLIYLLHVFLIKMSSAKRRKFWYSKFILTHLFPQCNSIKLRHNSVSLSNFFSNIDLSFSTVQKNWCYCFFETFFIVLDVRFDFTDLLQLYYYY